MHQPVTEAQKAVIGRHIPDLIHVVHLVHARLIVEDEEALNRAVRAGFLAAGGSRRLTSLGYLLYLLTEAPEAVTQMMRIAEIEVRQGTAVADRAFSEIFGRPAPPERS